VLGIVLKFKANVEYYVLRLNFKVNIFGTCSCFIVLVKRYDLGCDLMARINVRVES